MLKFNDTSFALRFTPLRWVASLLITSALLASSGCSVTHAPEEKPADVTLKQEIAKKYLQASPFTIKANKEKSLVDQITHIYTYSSAEALQAIEAIEKFSPKQNDRKTHIDIDQRIQQAVLLSRAQKNNDSKRALKILNQLLADYNDVISTEYQEFISLLISIINSDQQTQALLQQLAQQIREKNQAIQSLNDKIDALKAIEKSLGAR